MPRRITSLGEWPASEADAKKGHESDCTGTPSELSPHQSSSGLGGKDSGCGREAPAPEPAALPCLNSNNSNQVSPNKSAKKTGYKLTETIRYMVQKHGIDCIGFFTIGFPDPQPTPREASRRINILNAGVLSEHFLDYVSVYERGGKNKKIHFHFLVVCKQDIRTGADCDAIAHGDYSSANQALRAEWAFWRKVTNYDGKRAFTARYGHIGRAHLVPIKSNAEGIRKYVGKYIEKHMGARLPEDKGVRLLRMSKGLSRMTVQFAWNSPGATIFRIKLKQWAASRGIHTYEQLGGTLGPKWAHRNRERIASYPVDWNVLNPVRKYATQDGIVEVNLKDVECLERVHVAAVLVEEHECTFKTAMEYLAMPDNSSAKRAAFSEILNARNPF